MAAGPLAWLIFGWVELLIYNPASLRLSAEPVAHTHNQLGLTALQLLVATLALTPIRLISGAKRQMALRRMLGLWAFAYACLHLLFFLAMELDFSLVALWRDAMKRPFIFFGLTAFLCLLPLALTSTRAAIRTLGAVRWQRLHRLAYLAALLAAIHFILRVKGFQPEPWIYAVVIIALLVVRLLPIRQRATRAQAR